MLQLEISIAIWTYYIMFNLSTQSPKEMHL